LRTWKKTFRRPVVLVFSLVQPLMWMLFFGFLFHRYDLGAGPDGPVYIDFLVPGVCVMTVLFGASQSGTGLIKDMQGRFLARMLQTQAPVAALLGGKLLADVLRLLGQAVVVAQSTRHQTVTSTGPGCDSCKNACSIR
jgi:ABC-2 type transport system permease protein